ncbi:MAG: NAD(P)/FAD-dependent oxidoreductase [Candidatus Cloacimonetes bacterium]|nr:NAD(P)/FAD-dependent oxidoreductase [Candidatus Cloacimonadota bacterium]
MKIALIGFGASGIGFLLKMKHSDHEIHIFEKAKDIFSTSVSGIRADGKIFISKEMGGDLDIDLEIQEKVVQYYLSKTSCPDNEIEKGDSFANKSLFNEFYKYGFQPVSSKFWHIGTDELKTVLKNIFDEFSTIPNYHFHFNSEVTDIDINDKFHVNTKEQSYKFDKVIIGVGRSGHKLIQKIIKKEPNIIMDNMQVDLGIRFELPNHIVETLNQEMYEFKLKLKTRTGYMARTFCNNPSGFVVTEEYEDFKTVNGHAKRFEKSDNTNFAILVTHQFTEPFNDPVSYGSYIAKLTNILAGKNKVILQTVGNFKESKRTKKLYRVNPTLNNNDYILGDLNLAFPRKTTESILDFIDTLDKVIPGIANPDNLMYGTEVKFYSNKLNNNIIPGLSTIGDCSGWTRSITYATAHGIILAEEILKST